MYCPHMYWRNMLYIKTKAGSYIGEEVMKSYDYTGKEIIIIKPIMWKDVMGNDWVNWERAVRLSNIDNTRFFFVNDVEIKDVEKVESPYILPDGYKFV